MLQQVDRKVPLGRKEVAKAFLFHGYSRIRDAFLVRREIVPRIINQSEQIFYFDDG